MTRGFPLVHLFEVLPPPSTFLEATLSLIPQALSPIPFPLVHLFKVLPPPSTFLEATLSLIPQALSPLPPTSKPNKINPLPSTKSLGSAKNPREI